MHFPPPPQSQPGSSKPKNARGDCVGSVLHSAPRHAEPWSLLHRREAATRPSGWHPSGGSHAPACFVVGPRADENSKSGTNRIHALRQRAMHWEHDGAGQQGATPAVRRTGWTAHTSCSPLTSSVGPHRRVGAVGWAHLAGSRAFGPPLRGGPPNLLSSQGSICSFIRGCQEFVCFPVRGADRAGPPDPSSHERGSSWATSFITSFQWLCRKTNKNEGLRV